MQNSDFSQQIKLKEQTICDLKSKIDILEFQNSTLINKVESLQFDFKRNLKSIKKKASSLELDREAVLSSELMLKIKDVFKVNLE